LYRGPGIGSVPEFTEILESAACGLSDEGDSGAFFIGRRAAASAGKAAVHLQLVSDAPRLAKMISRVHARISWARTPIPAATDSSPPSLSRARSSQDKAAPAATQQQAYSYRWFIADQGSVNGVFVNSVKQPSSWPSTASASASAASSSSPSSASPLGRELFPGDKLTFGGGAGRDVGELVRQRDEEAVFVFRFNAVQRRPELPKGEELASTASANAKSNMEDVGAQKTKSKGSSATVAPAADSGGFAIRKRAHAATHSDAGGDSEEHSDGLPDDDAEAVPALKRRKSATGSAVRRTRRERSESPEHITAAAAGVGQAEEVESATQHFGDPSAASQEEEDGGTATQDFHDAARDAERLESEMGATQDFGGTGGHDVSAGPGASMEATQDGGGALFDH
jgi:hypothetical protein